MLRRLRMLVLGGFAGCALMLAPDKAEAQYYYYYSSPSYYRSPSYFSYYRGAYPYYGYSYYRPWRSYYRSSYRPWYGYRRGGWYGYGYPRFSLQIGPFGYTRW